MSVGRATDQAIAKIKDQLWEVHRRLAPTDGAGADAAVRSLAQLIA
jgi:hypothetical protein